MKKIYKYELSSSAPTTILNMPKGAEIIRFAKQAGRPMVWAIVNPGAPASSRTLSIVGTGHPIADDMRYIDTIDDDPYIWHLFELVS